jgi:aminoglycoside phosphotransferase
MGGFSPGVAARVNLANGGRFFIKVAGPQPNPDTPNIHRAEGRIAASLPPRAPVPRFVGTYDDGAWVGLVFEYIDGRPPTIPWTRKELDRVLAGLEHLSRSLTPSPVEAAPIQMKHVPYLQGWRRLLRQRFRVGIGNPKLDEWVESNLPRLAALEEGWPDAARGNTLLHADIRADNIILTPAKVYFVDWPWACVGAPWIDLMAMLPSVHLQGGPPPAELFDKHPLARKAPPNQVTTYLAALTGFYVSSSLQPSPPGLPTLREFQRAQGERALLWLRQRTGW